MRRALFFGLAIAIGMLWPSFSCLTRLANAGVVICYGDCDVDDDGDGYSDLAGDCDDATFAKHPGASETCLAAGGLTDDNCNGCTDEGCPKPFPEVGIIDCEQDDDGVSAFNGDCNDLNSNVYPGANEACGDGVDNDCDLVVDTDAMEICDNGVDDDCDERVDGDDPDCSGGGQDNDGDGYSPNDGDCNDDDSAINPDAVEVCGPPGIHDLAVTSITAPATVTIKGGVVQTKTVTVQIQNRGSHVETIPDAVALGNLVNLHVESLVLNCSTMPTVVLDLPKKFPVTLKSKGKTGVKFAVTFSGACDPAQTTKKNPGHDDHTYSATVHHSVLGGADAHPADDSCPRPAAGSDKGCAEERTDVVVK